MLKNRLKKIIIEENLLSPRDRVIVGVSAGPDSVALLCLLCQIDFPLSPVAIYIDHGLRPDEVKTEMRMVQKLAEQLHVAHRVIRVDVSSYKKEKKISLEAAARTLRYRALEKCRQEFEAKAIAIAHTADDQAEQILLRLIRGSGLKGLSGMRIRNNKIIRPLLRESKSELTKYLKDSQIPYCYDSSNSQITFLRNRIRSNLLPFLEKSFNPSIRTNLLQTADILAADENLLASLADQAFIKSVKSFLDDDDSGSDPALLLTLETFLQNHEAIRRRIMEKICWELEVRPSFRQIEQLCYLAERGKNGAELHMAKGLRTVKNQETILFSRPCGKIRLQGNLYLKPIQPLRIDEEGVYQVKNLRKMLSVHHLKSKPLIMEKSTLLLDGDRVTFPLILRTSEPGERFIPQGMTNRKKISRFLSDQKIPKQTRHLYPVLVSGSDIVAVAGLRIDQRYAIGENTTNILQVCWDSISTGCG